MDDIVADFYREALSVATSYWRAVGFFSSSALHAIGECLGSFVERGGTMRLITSVDLSEEDVAAIERGLDRRTVATERLLEVIKSLSESTFPRGADILSDLLEIGRLDIRIVMPERGSGIYHEKVGVFMCEKDVEFVAFAGSPNESKTAFEHNYECLDVYTSWEDPVRAAAKRDHFQALWKGEVSGAVTMDFPEAARQALIRLRQSTAPRVKEEAMGVRLWPHQVAAVDRFLQSERGILEMATGTGKTMAAVEICHRLADQGLIDCIVVGADGTDLLDQWYEQLLYLAARGTTPWRVLRHYGDHHQREQFLLNQHRAILLASRSAMAPAMRAIGSVRGLKAIVIQDEVHRLGSPSNQAALDGLSDHIRYRLGLSATPDREYDADGNAFISRHIGPVIYEFTLADAIRNGILSPFSYYPLEYTPTDDDRDRVQRIIARARALEAEGQPRPKEEVWMDIARVYKTSRAKLPVFETFIASNRTLLRRCIIFVETLAYGEEVLDIVHRFHHEFHTYFSAEDSDVLHRFAKGELECLITCHRLSEGIDIQNLESVILFSSARARLETVQRMGRCLRCNPRDPGKRANVVDFVRADIGDTEDSPDHQRQLWLEELSEIEPRSNL